MNLVTRDYEGNAIIFNDAGWINATDLAAKHGKRVDRWLANQETKDYIAALCEMTDTRKVGYVKTSKATVAAGGGTWFHPKLAVAFARWLDPRFAIWCDAQIDSLIRGKDDWRKSRHIAASSSKLLAEMLQDVRKVAGKATQSHHYANEHRLINYLLSGEYKGLDREVLTTYQLDFLAHFEVRNAVMLGMGLSYEQRKGALQVEALAWRELHAISGKQNTIQIAEA